MYFNSQISILDSKVKRKFIRAETLEKYWKVDSYDENHTPQSNGSEPF